MFVYKKTWKFAHISGSFWPFIAVGRFTKASSTVFWPPVDSGFGPRVKGKKIWKNFWSIWDCLWAKVNSLFAPWRPITRKISSLGWTKSWTGIDSTTSVSPHFWPNLASVRSIIFFNHYSFQFISTFRSLCRSFLDIRKKKRKNFKNLNLHNLKKNLSLKLSGSL